MATTVDPHEPLTDEDLVAYWSTRIQPWALDFGYLGHLAGAVYVKAFEEARYRYFRDRWNVTMPGYVIAKHEMTYTKEVLQEVTPIHVLMRPVHVGRSSMVFEELLLDDPKHVCNVSRVTLVAWDLDGHRSRALTDDERRALENDLEHFSGVTSRVL